MKSQIIKELAAKIEKDNAAFKKANKGRRRVLVAQDVLKRIEAEQILASKGDVIRLHVATGVLANRQKNPEADLKTLLNTCKNVGSCEVCAKGALFLGVVGRVNNMTIGEVRSELSVNDNVHEKLLEVFSLDQIALIECAFEGSMYISSRLTKLTANEIEKAEGFRDVYYSEEETLIAICQNIIKNKGTFIP